MANVPILALFDIDGTILASGKGARKSLTRSLFEFTNKEFTINTEDCAGKTDPLIITNFLERAGCETAEFPELLKSIHKRYIELIKINYNKTNDAFLYPGIPEILDRLTAEENIHLALLTGNIEEGARIKLSPFDLNRIFPAGAFGNDGFARTDLSQIAVNRAEDYYGITFESKNIVVIGDTANDVECGKIINARSIAISRRPEALDKLKASNPDHLFFGTEKVDQFIKAVFN